MIPTISIVTPSFNQGKYIEETINSVLSQSFRDYEYIIIDGGSTDNTVEIIMKYNKYLTYWISEKDSGQAHAINKGWKISKGKIISYLNSDDLLNENALSIIVNEFDKFSDAAIIYGDCQLINKNGGRIGELKGREVNYKTLLYKGQVNIFQPATFFNAKLVKSVNYLNPNWQYCMDYDLLLKLTKISPIYYVPEILASFRIHNSSKSASQSYQHWKEKFKVRKQYSNGIFIYAHIKFILFLILNAFPKPLKNLFRRIRKNPLDKTIIDNN